MGKIKDPVRFSAHFGVDPAILRAARAFDPIMNADTLLFIDPLLLAKSREPLMVKASEDWHDYFRKIIKLVGASAKRHDEPWRAAARMIKTGEFKGTCLGYGSGTIDGRGIGPALTAQILDTAKAIVTLGVSDPEFFSLLPLFEEDVGSDLISDQATTIIAHRLATFTVATLSKLEIERRVFVISGNKFLLPANPFANDGGRHVPVMLVPRDVLASLPVAYGPEDIDTVTSHNETLRRRINQSVGNAWARFTKGEIKGYILSSKSAFKKFLDANREKRIEPYNLDVACSQFH